jgi:hypothetical protein
VLQAYVPHRLGRVSPGASGDDVRPSLQDFIHARSYKMSRTAGIVTFSLKFVVICESVPHIGD